MMMLSLPGAMVATVSAVALMGIIALPPSHLHYYFSYVPSVVERWDLALDVIARAKSSLDQERQVHRSEMADDEEARFALEQTETIILYRLGDLHFAAEEYDEAIAVYLDELVPRLKRGSGSSSTEPSTDSYLEVGLLLGDVAEIYRMKGDYKMGLKLLAEAQNSFFKSEAASSEKSMLLEQNAEKVVEMKELIDFVREQKEYLGNYIMMARRWNFRGRKFEENSGDGCLDFADHSKKRRKRFYNPPTISFLFTVAFILFCSAKFTWSNPTRNRFILSAAIGALLLVLVLSYWEWVEGPFVERLNVLGTIQESLGQGERALATFDEARCAILTSPQEEALIASDIVLETFMGPSYIYAARGEFNVMDRLADDIANLLKTHAFLEPSWKVLNYYLNLASRYEDGGFRDKSKHYDLMAKKEAKELSLSISIATEEELKKLLNPTSNLHNVSDTERIGKETNSQPEIKIGIR